MADGPFDRLRAVLIRARELPDADRDAFIRDACAGDEALYAEARSLLGYDAGLEVLRTAAFAGAIPAALAVVAPERIGPYHLLEVLGEGGMGVVYRAGQSEPIARHVALKLIRRGMDSDRIVARFALERQTMAGMSHRFIARVFDAGTLDDGRPYFVMELVDGPSVTRFASDRGLDVETRLSLFRDVCLGVRHAHRQGIIHRDLKPSNILVAEQDGVAVPKIIDFGIAKALGAEGPDLTQGAPGVGTPAYMSPEQAGAEAAPIDTRTDVYALGVLLYELLTGVTPFTFTEGTPAEIYRVHRDEAPVRPSAVPTPAMPASRLAGDLDSIVLKAIEKQPDARYASVDALLDDLERHRAGLPVEARSGSWWYRAGKFVRRHRVAVGASAGAVLVLATTLVAVSASLVAARRERDRATEAMQMANGTTDFLVEMLGAANPRNRPLGSTSEVRVRDLLDEAAARLEQGAFAGEPLLESRLHFALGQSYRALGTGDADCQQLGLALTQGRRATAPLDERVLGYLDEYVTCQTGLGRADVLETELADLFQACQHEPAAADSCRYVVSALGDLRFAQSRFAEAEVEYRRALRMSVGLPPDTPYRIGAELDLAKVLYEEKAYGEAEPIFKDIIERQSRVRGADHPATLTTVHELAMLYDETGRREEGLALYDRVVAGRLKTLGPDSEETLRAQNQLGIAYATTGRLEDGLRLFRQVVESKLRTLGAENPSTILSEMNLAMALVDLGRRDDAVDVMAPAIGRARTALPRGHAAIAMYLLAHGKALADLERWRAAEAAAREAHDRLVAARGPGAAPTRDAAGLMARILRETGREAEAGRWAARAAADSPSPR